MQFIEENDADECDRTVDLNQYLNLTEFVFRFCYSFILFFFFVADFLFLSIVESILLQTTKDRSRRQTRTNSNK